MFKKLKNINIRLFCKNLSLLLTEDVRGRVDKLDNQGDNAVSQRRLGAVLMEHDILGHREELLADYNDEVAYLRKTGRLEAFPYPQRRQLKSVRAEWDVRKGMPYVWHADKRLYFPSSWSTQQAAERYRYYVEVENLVGGGYMVPAPHQYQTEEFRVKKGDVVVDVGASEGLFALDVAERASKVYLIEADETWIAPLEATFWPYRDKTVIINRFVSGADTERSVRLQSILGKVESPGFFLKMDIEGHEKAVLQASRELLCQNRDIRIACCTYHRHDDAEGIRSILNEMGYETHYSDGVILFLLDMLNPPYFRKALIRAARKQI